MDEECVADNDDPASATCASQRIWAGTLVPTEPVELGFGEPNDVTLLLLLLELADGCTTNVLSRL